MYEDTTDIEAQREEMFRIISDVTQAMREDYEALEELDRQEENGILTGPQGDPGYWPGLEGSDPNWERWLEDPDYIGEPSDTAGGESGGEYSTIGAGSEDIGIIFTQEEECRTCLTEPIRPVFRIVSGSGAVPASVEVNGEQMEYYYVGGTVSLKDMLTEDGTYDIVVKATDVFGGNETVKEVSISIDRTPPSVETAGVGEKPGRYYKEARLQISGDDPDARLCEFTLDGEPVSPEDVTVTDDGLELLVNTPGKHTVTAQYEDAAGNRSERSVRVFTITDGPGGYIGAHVPAAAGLCAAAVCGILLAVLSRKDR